MSFLISISAGEWKGWSGLRRAVASLYMEKQAYIHLHGLFAETATYLASREGEIYAEEDYPDAISLDDALDLYGDDAADRYRRRGTRPNSIHRSKADHHDAVFDLLDLLDEAIAEERGEEPCPRRPR